jgi:uncharacterized protein (DUF58 family)
MLKAIDELELKKFENYELIARQLVEGFITGLHKSPYHGFSVEFAEHRLYNTGESTRNIDWKVYAKTDRLYVKRYEEETNLRCNILLDNSLSMRYPEKPGNKLEFSLLAASALIHLMIKQRDAVGLMSFSDRIESQTPVKSNRAHARALFSHLNRILNSNPERKTTKIAEILHQVAENIHKRSLVIIFSDMFSSESETDELFAALQHLKHNKHEVLLFHVTDSSTEYRFDFSDRPHTFIDLESGDKIKLNPAEIKTYYQRAYEKFHEELKLKCHQYHIDFIECDIAFTVDEVLNSYLVKRKRMQ